MPITDYVTIKKKRGRRKKTQAVDPNIDMCEGSIISLTKKRLVRGVILKPKKIRSTTYFRHSVSVVMILENQKMLNVKVSRNGKLQMTGCKTIKHAIDFIKHLYSLMIEAEEWTGETLFSYKTNDNISDDEIKDDVLEECDDPQELQENEPILDRNENNGLCVTFRVAMMNCDFSTGYKIRRDLLSKFINKYTDFRSIFEASIGTSVNIKIKAEKRFNTHLTRLRITAEGECIEESIPYEAFFSTLTAKEQKDEVKKVGFHTFLVFRSGSVIYSSSFGVETPGIFYKLVKLLIEHRKMIEEHDDDKTIVDSTWLDSSESFDI